jgi:ClpP class serine protease
MAIDSSLLFWLFIVFTTLLPAMQRQMIARARVERIRQLEKTRGSRVITMIHRQETMALLGIPIVRFINIEDSEAILQAIRLTPPEVPIDLVLHTPGGLVLASEQIAEALKRHRGKVTVMVPHYAMSGGTMISLAANEIVMDENAVLGPVDPQIGEYPAASIVQAAMQPNPNRDDRTLILADIAQKALRQVYDTVLSLLLDRMAEERAREVAHLLTQGTWTHDYPIDVGQLRALGFTVDTGLPEEVYDLMRLFPQPPQRRPSVEYIPAPYHPQAPTPEPLPAPRSGRK